MNSDLTLLAIEAVAVYVLVLGTHALRRRFGLAHFYALLGGITTVMSWITDAGVAVNVGGITFMVGSTVFYTSLLLGVFVIYVFDGPHATRVAISTIAGVSIFVPLIAVVLHMQMRLTGQADLAYIPIPSLRINSASVIATITNLLFLGMVWEFLGSPRVPVGLGIRAFATLLGVMWLDVLLFGTGAFLGTPEYLGILKGTFVSRLVIATFAWPFLYVYLKWQSGRPDTEIENRPVLAILRDVAQVRGELGSARQELEHGRQIERALRESEQRYRALFDGAAEGILIADAGTRKFRYANPAICALFGYTEEELTGMDVEQVHPEEALPAVFAAFEAQARGELRLAPDLPCLRKSGEIFYADINTAAIEVDGRPSLAGFFTDVTARRSAEQELMSSRGFLDSVINAIADPVFVKDEKRRFVLVNDALCKIVGRPRKGLIGEDGDDMFPREQVEVFRKVDARVFGTGEENLNEEALSNLSTGEVRTIVTRKSRYIDADGKQFLVGVIRDITERLELEAQVRQQQKLASVGTLTRGMAHEINNPIMGIMNYAQLILDRLGTESPAAEFATEIGTEAARVAALVKNLLAFSSHEPEAHRSPARMHDIVEGALSLVRTAMHKDNITLTVNVPEDLPLVKCRTQQIQQVTMNLLTNAREALNDKYPGSDENKIVRVSAREVSGVECRVSPNTDSDPTRDTRHAIRLTVEDHGPGIPDAVCERLFEPFFTTKDRTQSAGLGLSVSHGIVREHGGELSVASEIGQWTRFSLDLPAVPAEASQAVHPIEEGLCHEQDTDR